MGLAINIDHNPSDPYNAPITLKNRDLCRQSSDKTHRVAAQVESQVIFNMIWFKIAHRKLH